ncbi:MAG: hypothetical protein EZS28_004456 [Streblomastix strix]|uniref:NADP transhydrogenase beta-like domain-containing protein n=1 Tax=Streblomastix strix TaxID=222440 RepID=A0A5J4WZP6_9EUKA|nr:MAG: hypothetical protein EZS28_004456 [Streblomastix strix]
MISSGVIICTFVALRVVMAFMSELIAFIYSFVGLAAIFISFRNFFSGDEPAGVFALCLHRFECNFVTFIGAVTFTGPLIAYCKQAFQCQIHNQNGIQQQLSQ